MTNVSFLLIYFLIFHVLRGRKPKLHYGGYNCDVMSLFELGSLHHDYYLINVKFPLNEDQTINTHIGQLNDVWLVVIHQNGGFTQVAIIRII